LIVGIRITEEKWCTPQNHAFVFLYHHKGDGSTMDDIDVDFAYSYPEGQITLLQFTAILESTILFIFFLIPSVFFF
jgi:hypothetical protein